MPTVHPFYSFTQPTMRRNPANSGFTTTTSLAPWDATFLAGSACRVQTITHFVPFVPNGLRTDLSSEEQSRRRIRLHRTGRTLPSSPLLLLSPRIGTILL